MLFKEQHKGFTLIELLVVISIIGLLSSVVLASLSNARGKAKDAAIIQGIQQFRLLLEQEYSDTGSYANLIGDADPIRRAWHQNTTDCNTGYSGTYATQAVAICKNIMANTLYPNTVDATSGWGSLWTGPGGSNLTSKYTLMVYLPGKKTIYCLGSDGAQSSTESGSTAWSLPGCYSNY